MTFRFGTFEFGADDGTLRKNGRAVALEPQPSKALALLLSRAGEVVSRDELRDAVWERDTHVDFDRGLAYCISQIRVALGDSGDNPRFVETVPRRGFRFIAPVSPGEPAAPSAPAAPAAPAAPVAPASRFNRWITVPLALATLAAAIGMVVETLRSRPETDRSDRVVIAVSIFDNETGLAEHDRLVAGLSDLVVERLTKLEPDRITVVGNAAVLRQPRNIRNLKALSETLAAHYVLLGQLQQGESGLRFITHVIRLRDEAHLKANRLVMPGGGVTGLEAAVVDEFERVVREHVLTRGAN
jgi:DNA-binding winged helix-turn-helix (wHTH) protein/TolB-like protein